MTAPDELDSDRQSVRAAMGRQADRRRVQDGPDRLETGIAGVTKPTRRFTVGAGGEQQVEIAEHSGQPRPAILAQPYCRDVVFVRHGTSELDAPAQALADAVPVRAPL